MRSIATIDYTKRGGNGVVTSAYKVNEIIVSIVPLDTQKTNLMMEVTDVGGSVHTTEALTLSGGLIEYIVPISYWERTGTMKVRLLSNEGNSEYTIFNVVNVVSVNVSNAYVSYDNENGQFTIKTVSGGGGGGGIDIDMVFPVGCVITNARADFDPNTLYAGTTWKRIKGRVIVGIDENDTDFATTGKTGGSKALTAHNHTMAHTHSFSATTGSGGAHTHSVSGTAASNGAHSHSMTKAWRNDASGYDGFIPKSGSFYANATTGNTASAGAHSHNVSGTAASNGAHTHSVSGTTGGSSATNTGTAGTGDSGNLQPYITKYVWERTA